jgi:PPOX class probable F420-dependent enzyme
MPFELTDMIERRLRDDVIAWLTTVTPSGKPAPRPVWFVWDGAAIIIYSQPNVAKLRHIAANPQVTVNFNSGATGGDIVVISGTAELVPGAPLPSEFPGMQDKYTAMIQAMGYEAEWYNTYSEAIRVTPVSAWTIGS